MIVFPLVFAIHDLNCIYFLLLKIYKVGSTSFRSNINLATINFHLPWFGAWEERLKGKGAAISFTFHFFPPLPNSCQFKYTDRDEVRIG